MQDETLKIRKHVHKIVSAETKPLEGRIRKGAQLIRKSGDTVDARGEEKG